MWRMLLKEPNTFFQAFKTTPPSNSFVLKGMLCLFVGTACEALNQLALLRFLKIPPEQLTLLEKQAWLSLYFSPATALFGIYLFASSLHLLIKPAFRYETTLYLVSVCQVPMLVAIFPVVGPMLSSIWVFVLLVKALRQVYGLSFWAAFAAILLPAFFLKLTWASALQLLALSV